MTELVPFEEAEKEAAKALGKEMARLTLGFLADITRPPAKELGGLLADHVKFFRFKTQIKILEKARTLQQRYNLSLQQVPLRIIAPLLEGCSWEEDEWMQTKWAALLANAATHGERHDNYSTYVELLRQLSPVQARCLDIMYAEESFPARRYLRTLPSYQSRCYLQGSLGISHEELDILFDGLVRLNLIHPKLRLAQGSGHTSEIQDAEVDRDFSEVSLTCLGKGLVKKCRIPFLEIHKDEFRNLLVPVVEEIAKDHDGSQFRKLVEKAADIYEYLDEEGIKTAVWGALGHTLWKGQKIDEFKDFPLKESQKNEIVKYALGTLTEMYS